MNTHAKILWRNRLIRFFPGLSTLTDTLVLVNAYRGWRSAGWSSRLPGQLKRCIIKAEARRMGARVLVETGTFLGDTLWCLRKDFDELYSIEIEPRLAEIAAQRFSALTHIHVCQGDSATVLSEVCAQIQLPSLFWLDGHYSGGITGRGGSECPIWGELDGIFATMRAPFGILIDDAWCFGSNPSYPRIEELQEYLLAKKPDYRFYVENDLIFYVPFASSTTSASS